MHNQPKETLVRIEGFEPEPRVVPGTRTIQDDDNRRPGIEGFNKTHAQFGERQENFYRNLIRMYRLSGEKTLPVYFEDGQGNPLKMDRACISFAVHDGFLGPLEEDASGAVRYVTLNW
jgi:hypothetical protein